MNCKNKAGNDTIPKKIRDLLQLKTGDKIEIIVTDDREAVIRPISKRVDDMFCKLHKAERKPAPVEALDDAIRERLKDEYK